MIKALFDTNIILDYLLDRPFWRAEAGIIAEAIDKSLLQPMMTSSSLTDVAYLAYKTTKDRAIQRSAVAFCVHEMKFIHTSNELILDAFRLNGLDFEDDLQIVSAIAASCDCIVTRDQKGFRQCPVEVVGPWELAARLAC